MMFFKIKNKICCTCKRPFLCNVFSKTSLNADRKHLCHNSSITQCECQHCYAKRLLGKYTLSFIWVSGKYYSPQFNFGIDKYLPQLPYEFSCWLITKEQVEEWAIDVL